MRGPGGLSAMRRLLGAEVRPGRVLRWFTTRRIMVLVAIVAVGLAVDALRRRRDRFLSLAGQHRTREQRAREFRVQFDERRRSSVSYYRRCIAHWAEEAEGRAATEQVAICRGLLRATDRLILALSSGPLQDADLSAYRDEVARRTAGSLGGWTLRIVTRIDEQLRPDSLGNLNATVGDMAKSAAGETRNIEYCARMAAKYERAAARPWESVEPDPPRP